MHHFSKQYLLLICLLVLLPLSCKEKINPDPIAYIPRLNLHPNDVVYDWNELMLKVERYANGFRPGPAVRAIAYLGLSDYEASLKGMPDYKSIASLLPGLNIPAIENDKQYHWPTIINNSRAYLMPRLFPTATPEQFAAMAELEQYYNNKGMLSVVPEVYERSKEYGKAVAEAVWEFSMSDMAGHNHFLDPFQGYQWQDHYSVNGDWKPTFPGPGKPIGGVWGNARTFVLQNNEKTCPPPVPFSQDSASQMYGQAIATYTNANETEVNYENRWIGEFWSDDHLNLTFSNGLRWISIGDQVLKAEKSNLETAVLMTVKLGFALCDASIASWHSKFYYNLERPQTYINRVIKPLWQPKLNNPLTGDSGISPSYPTYPSGHATMAGAASKVLEDLFGNHYALSDRSHENRSEFEGIPRTFLSFSEMALECANSRILLGVCFPMDVESGLTFGTGIGDKVIGFPWKN